MGAILGCASTAAACCFCGTAASVCCSCFSSVSSSTSSRIMYGVMLLVFSSLASISLSPGLRTTLSKIPGLCNGSATAPLPIPYIKADLDCDLIVGYAAVYRICFALCVFFLIMSILMIRVQSSRDPRARIQNGFWGIKYLAVILLCVGAFFIPNGRFTSSLTFVGAVGGFMFIIIQLALLVDFVHSWNEKWLSTYEEEHEKGYLVCLILCTVLFYAGALASVVLMFVYFGGSGCGMNTFFIVVNAVACAAVSLLSMASSVREHLPTSGLLQSSSVTMYVMYLTMSAMRTEPIAACNPFLDLKNLTDVTNITAGNPIVTSAVLNFTWYDVLGLLLFLCIVMYSCIRSSTSTSVIGKMDITSSDHINAGDMHDGGEQGASDNECEQVAYNYSLYHVLLLLGSLYVMVSLTNWYHPSDSDLTTLNASMWSTWVKIVSSWICIALYGWSLVAPSVLSDRSFG